ncbi:hypothetical protein [Microvirga flavescens]|uniref:hypothetical protein n=1 Tax=Microvirga flavescens TaxID=2249811 RepID=UPI00130069E3|nr:hypothetical protein [Microvirga flavescens]
MLGTSGTFVAIAGIAVVASFAHASLPKQRAMTPARAPELSLGQTVAAERKGDRIAIPSTSAARSSVMEVEWVGSEPMSVLLRGGTGEVLYLSDQGTATTIFAKNTDLPILTVKPRGSPPPVLQQPVEQQESKDAPKRKGSPIGCTNPLSPLVKSDVTLPPGLCVVMHEPGEVFS